MSIISLRNVTKRFGSKTIFKNLSFDVEEKELVALIGPSGSGKSTILNMIGLLEPVDQGDIFIKNQALPSVNSTKATHYRKNIINYLFQNNALISTISIKDNLMLALHFSHLSKKEKEFKILETLELVELKDHYHRIVNELSGGEQQRVAIARAILKPGSIILADEPTGSLDPLMAQKAFDLITELRDKFGKTVLIVTHNLDQAKQCDRIINLSDYTT